MQNIGQPILAGLIAGSITLLELITSKYPRTFFLLKKSKALYGYTAVYGAIAMGVMFGLDTLISNGIVKLEGFGLSNSWMRAVLVGLVVKSFLHIRLFSVTVGSQPFPVGVETLVQLFEPWLLRTVEVDHFNSARQFIASRAAHYPDLAAVKNLVQQNLPPTFSAVELAAFMTDVNKSASTVEVMELYLAFLGRSNFNRVFPI